MMTTFTFLIIKPFLMPCFIRFQTTSDVKLKQYLRLLNIKFSLSFFSLTFDSFIDRFLSVFTQAIE